MKIPALLFIFFFSLHLLADLTTHHIVLGTQTILPLSMNRVWIENSKIIKGENSGSSLRVTGVGEGSSLLSIGTKQYQIYVIHPKKQEALLKIQDVLKKQIGLKVEYSQGDTRITGEIFRLQNWKNLAEKLKYSEVFYKMSASFSDSVKIEAQSYFDDTLTTAGLSKQKLNFSDSVSIRLGQKNSHLSQYRKILSPFGIEIFEDANSLSLEPTIRVQITVAEVSRSWTQKIGLRWPDSYQAQLLPNPLWNFTAVDGLVSFFEQNGNGKVLASPNIICRSGKEAEFLAGGEFPIKIINPRMQDVIWKKYGILLKVKPQADALGQMSIQIDTEVSTIDDSKKVDNIPGLITNKVSSYFDLRSPQTIALSGLIKNDESKASEGMPWISRIPIFGALFSSQDFRENRTELVIFVRPEVIDLQSPPAQPEHLVNGTRHENK